MKATKMTAAAPAKGAAMKEVKVMNGVKAKQSYSTTGVVKKFKAQRVEAAVGPAVASLMSVHCFNFGTPSLVLAFRGPPAPNNKTPSPNK